MNRLEEIYDAFPEKNWSHNLHVYNSNLYTSFFVRIMRNFLLSTRKRYKNLYIGNDNFIPTEHMMEILGIDDFTQLQVSSYMTIKLMSKYDLSPKDSYSDQESDQESESGETYDFDIDELSSFCSWEVCQGFDYEWNYFNLSSNSHITIDIIKANPGKPWSFQGLSTNPNLTIEYFIENINKQWDFRDLSEHRIITLDIIKKYKDLPWDISKFSRNINVDWETVVKNPDMDWDYSSMSANPNISFDLIKNTDYGWDLNTYCLNPSLTVDIIQQNNSLSWDFSRIADNEFTFDKDYYLKLQTDILKKSQFIISDLKHIISKYI